MFWVNLVFLALILVAPSNSYASVPPHRQEARICFGENESLAGRLFSYGLAYHHDTRSKTGQEKAFRLFLESAKLGNRSPQFNTGIYYVKGLAGSKDAIRGYAWLTLSAESGVPKARNFQEKVGRRMSGLARKEALTRSSKLRQKINQFRIFNETERAGSQPDTRQASCESHSMFGSRY